MTKETKPRFCFFSSNMQVLCFRVRSSEDSEGLTSMPARHTDNCSLQMAGDPPDYSRHTEYEHNWIQETLNALHRQRSIECVGAGINGLSKRRHEGRAELEHVVRLLWVLQPSVWMIRVFSQSMLLTLIRHTEEISCTWSAADGFGTENPLCLSAVWEQWDSEGAGLLHCLHRRNQVPVKPAGGTVFKLQTWFKI